MIRVYTVWHTYRTFDTTQMHEISTVTCMLPYRKHYTKQRDINNVKKWIKKFPKASLGGPVPEGAEGLAYLGLLRCGLGGYTVQVRGGGRGGRVRPGRGRELSREGGQAVAGRHPQQLTQHRPTFSCSTRGRLNSLGSVCAVLPRL